jgi:Trypsin-like peptidase domain
MQAFLKSLLLLAALLPTGTSAANAIEEGMVTTFGSVYEPNKLLSRGVPRTELDKGEAVRYYRLHIRIKDNANNLPWRILVRSQAGQLLTMFDEKAPGCSDEGCWTRRLPSSKLSVEFHGDNESAKAHIDKAIYMRASVEKSYYSPIEGKGDPEALSSLSQGNADEKDHLRRTGDRLGMFMSSGKFAQTETHWCCSGIRLTRDLFMTNWHCGALNGASETSFWDGAGAGAACKNALVDMSWDGDALSREYGCVGVQRKNKTLDYAIIRLGRIADGEELIAPIDQLRLSEQPPVTGSDIAILQHNACKEKSVARSCQVQGVGLPGWKPEASTEKSDFNYNCPTEGGSSGGPVYDKALGTIIGLHHLGYKAQTTPAPDKFNTGVEMRAIVSDIKKDALLWAEIERANQ